MTDADAAGWFADPGGKAGTYRWWDGAVWTRWLSADPATPGPNPTLTAPENCRQTADPPVESGQPVGSFRGGGPTEAGPMDPGGRAVRLPAAVAVLGVAVVLAVIAVGSIVTFTTDRPLKGPAVAPPPRVAPPLAVTYDPQTRTASAQELKVVLPDAPFTCEPRPRKMGTLFSSALSCTAVVHPDYAPDRDWSAVTGVGVLAPGPATDDLRKLTASIGSKLILRNYDTGKIKIEKGKNRPFADVAPEGRARVVTAELRLSYESLPTAYDSLRVAVFRLDSGEHVAWWGFIPDDSPEPLQRAWQESAETITARK